MPQNKCSQLYESPLERGWSSCDMALRPLGTEGWLRPHDDIARVDRVVRCKNSYRPRPRMWSSPKAMLALFQSLKRQPHSSVT